MSEPDPIASPTLARLYLAQGHLPRARAMLRELLEKDPHDGDALVLIQRLGPFGGRVTARVEDGDLVVGWQGIAVHPNAHVLAVTAAPQGARVRIGVTSVPCKKPFGRVAFARPPGRGALAACIGRVVSGHGFVALAIAPPVSWP